MPGIESASQRQEEYAGQSGAALSNWHLANTHEYSLKAKS
jgi:hypothetical protein